MSDFKPGAAVKIHRPNKKEHGWVGRFVELAADPHFAWIAFDVKHKRAVLPKQDSYQIPANYPRTLFPLSQILPYEPAS